MSDTRRVPALDSILQDLRYTFRTLCRTLCRDPSPQLAALQ